MNHPLPTLDTTLLHNYFTPDRLIGMQARVDEVIASLRAHSCPGYQFLGWMDLPSRTSEAEIKAVANMADEIRQQADCLVVIGIGGSYLGARAVIEGCSPALRQPGQGPEILYAGHHLSADYAEELVHHLQGKRFYINVISKSGTTTEPGIAFRILAEQLKKNVGAKEFSRRIIATTDASKGALRGMAAREGFRTFAIPDEIGGRFSVLTPVGLLPIAAAGLDIDALLDGAREMENLCRSTQGIIENPVLSYAVARHLLHQAGKKIEVLAVFEPYLQFLAEWWKQLYGESEGKDGKGLFPASVVLTTDLHSMGQYLQDGPRHLFETFIIVDESASRIAVPEWQDDPDGMNYLAHRELSYINQQAYRGTAAAHDSGGAPSMTLHLPRRDACHFGQLIYFFEFAVAVSGLLLGVNPFDQPGVDAYKKNMFALLGKK